MYLYAVPEMIITSDLTTYENQCEYLLEKPIFTITNISCGSLPVLHTLQKIIKFISHSGNAPMMKFLDLASIKTV